jgi:UDP-glucose 4-epimerase
VTTPFLVTGAAGGLGRALAARLPQDGLTAVDREAPPSGATSRSVRGDISSLPWAGLLGPGGVAFHLAAIVHQRPRDESEVRLTYAVNADATARLAAACREAGATLVLASTVAVLGSGAPGPIGDGAPPDPATHYARSKLLAEEAVRGEGARGLRYVILRLPLLYGSWGRGNLERMLRAIGRRTYWPLGDQSTPKSVLCLDDAAEALLLAVRTPAVHQGTWIVGPPAPATLGQIHEAAYAAMGRWRPPALPGWALALAAGGLDAALRLAGREAHFGEAVRKVSSPAWYDGSGFAAATGFEPRVSLAEGMARTASWLREEAAG